MKTTTSQNTLLVKLATAAAVGCLTISAAMADGHSSLSVSAKDQSVAGGTVTAEEIVAGENGWLVVHRTGDHSKPGPVIGHAPLKKGKNSKVTAILTEPVKAGEKMMLMLHAEKGGTKTGIFEYTLGAKEDGPVKVDGKLVMSIVTAQ